MSSNKLECYLIVFQLLVSNGSHDIDPFTNVFMFFFEKKHVHLNKGVSSAIMKIKEQMIN